MTNDVGILKFPTVNHAVEEIVSFSKERTDTKGKIFNMDYSSSIAEEPLSLSILSSFAEEPLVSSSVDEDNFESVATRSGESAKEAFEPLLTSTPAKRKGEAIEHESLDSSRAEEPIWPEHSASMEQEEENSSGEDSKDDDTIVRS